MRYIIILSKCVTTYKTIVNIGFFFFEIPYYVLTRHELHHGLLDCEFIILRITHCE